MTGEKTASSPGKGKTIDGALATGFSLEPREEKTITFVLSWYFPKRILFGFRQFCVEYELDFEILDKIYH